MLDKKYNDNAPTDILLKPEIGEKLPLCKNRNFPDGNPVKSKNDTCFLARAARYKKKSLGVKSRNADLRPQKNLTFCKNQALEI